ncbi:MAG: PEP-utilizing enzyme [archaeon]
MYTKNFDSLKKYDWVWFWSGNWPLFDCSSAEEGKEFKKVFLKLTGTVPTLSALLFKGHNLTKYQAEEHYSRLRKVFFKNYDSNPAYVSQVSMEFDSEIKENKKLIEEISAENFSSKNNAELIELFALAKKALGFVLAMDFWCWYTEYFFTPRLEKLVSESLSDKNMVSDVLIKITTPFMPSKTLEEEESLVELAKMVLQEKINIESFNEIDLPEFNEKLNNHLEKFCWIPVLVNNKPLTKKDILNEIKNKSKEDLSKYKGMNSKLEKTKSDFNSVLNELNLGEKELKFVKELNKTAFYRAESNFLLSYFSFKLIPLYSEMAERIGLTYGEMKNFTDEEVERFLKYNSKADRQALNERTEFCYMLEEGKYFLETGDNALKIKSIIEGIPSSDSEEKMFFGMSASPGMITGKARVLSDSSEISKIEKGDILVAPATSVDFVPAMKKASAIITEFGGITSHAAIVSRELGIPCIVGVKNIAKILKDGDKIKVDAFKGLIEKVD